MKYTVRYVGGAIGRWFRGRGWTGVTLPVPFKRAAIVLMWDDGEEQEPVEAARWLRHEVLGHVPQIEEKGGARYLARVLYEYARYGHDKAPVELDANRRAEAAHLEGDSQ